MSRLTRSVGVPRAQSSAARAQSATARVQTPLSRMQPSASRSQTRSAVKTRSQTSRFLDTPSGRPIAESSRIGTWTVPRSGGVPRVSSGYGRTPVGYGKARAGPSASSLRSSASKCGSAVCAQKGPRPRSKTPPRDEKQVAKDIVAKQEAQKKTKAFELPPLSVLIPKRDVYEELEKLKSKTRRRQAPEGEDTKAIREILKNMVNQEVTVHECVGLLSPYTADNGTVLRNVLANELSHFRTMARRVYDTMTQDVSDVLINEHVQLTEASKERHAQCTDKMMRAIDEIYEYVPQFNFEKYYADPNYLDTMFPLHREVSLDEEAEELQMRQEAYHRLMWLRSEGDRLGEENKRLTERLKELKQRQKEQMKKAGKIEKINEDKRKELEEAQEALEEKLEVMNTSIEKTIVEHEKAIREQEDVLPPRERKKKVLRQIPKKVPERWNTKAAAQIEESLTTEALVSEVSRVSMASSAGTSKGGVASRVSAGAIPKRSAPKKKKYKFERPKVQQDKDPFHYSPVKTPPEAAGGVPNMQTTRVRTTTSNVEEPPKPAPPRMGRKSGIPRESWGGYY